MYTKEEVLNMEKIKSWVIKRAQEVIEKKDELDGVKTAWDSIDDVEIYGNNVNVSVREHAHCGCCSDDCYTITIKLDWLFNDDWIPSYAQIVEHNKNEALRLKAEKEAKQEEINKANRKKRYEELKQEFEEDK